MPEPGQMIYENDEFQVWFADAEGERVRIAHRNAATPVEVDAAILLDALEQAVSAQDSDASVAIEGEFTRASDGFDAT